MKRWVYNASMACGLAGVGVGIGLEHGVGYGLTASGAILIGLTVFGARIAAFANDAG